VQFWRANDTVPFKPQPEDPRWMGDDMLFLFGVRTKAKPIAQIEYPCSKCARSTMYTAMESKRWFTLFFIPVIPLGSTHVVRCNLCGLVLKCSPELKARLTSKAMAAGA
jgi:hypothetical protein